MISPAIKKPSTLGWNCWIIPTRPSETLNRLLLESHELHERTAVLLMSDRRARHVAKVRETFFMVLRVGRWAPFLLPFLESGCFVFCPKGKAFCTELWQCLRLGLSLHICQVDPFTMPFL